MEDGRPQPVSPAARATPADLARLSSLLDEALDLPEAGRADWLESLRARSAPLATTLAGLLARASGSETADLLDRGPGLASPCAPPEFAAGDTVGPYRLLRPIGQGGMGEVWLAERADGQLKRQVALKLPVLGLRRSVLVQRFERERDILASLEHPHIARLYDAGLAADGQPYLALEHVEGTPIAQYCDEQRLDARARVELLRQVMQAVQYAHASLVIHRDLKPSNVLVTVQGEARLLDFGIAKLLQDEQAQADETELTRVGGRALTLQYAAPEQVSGGSISIAADVWALGVLLYELLTGRLPFSAGDRGALERAVLEQDPARPSSLRAGVITGLPRGLAADLDTIVLKALKKSPAERYTTVNAFADDLGRWLAGEPVRAQRDSRAYQLRKFVARHRVPVAAGSVAALALITASTVALLQASDARREARRAQAVQGFLTDLFQANSSEQPDPQAGRRTTARELLDRGAARVDEALRDDPQSRFEVLRTLADMYWQLDLPGEAAALERRRVELARRLYGARDARLAKVLLDYAETVTESEHRDEVPALVDEALAVLDAAGASDSEARGQALVIAADYWRHGSLTRSLRAADDAVDFLRRHHPTSDRLVAAHMHAARMRLLRGEFDAAAAQATQALEAVGRLGPDAAPTWSWMPTSTLADVRSAQLVLDQAERALRDELELALRVHGEDHGRTLTSRARLGNLLFETGRTAEAEAQHDAVREGMRRNTRMERTQREYIAGILGLQLLERGRPDRLEPILRADLDELRRTIPQSALLIVRQRLWALVQSALGRHGAARESMVSAQAMWRHFADGADTAPMDAVFAAARARIETAAGDPAAALRALDGAPPAGALRPALAHHVERARALLALGRPQDALDAVSQAKALLASLPAGYRPVAVQADAELLVGRARLALGDATAAEDALRSAFELRRRHDATESLWVAEAQAALAQCLASLGRRAQARALRADAQDTHAEAGTPVRNAAR